MILVIRVPPIQTYNCRLKNMDNYQISGKIPLGLVGIWVAIEVAPWRDALVQLTISSQSRTFTR